MKIFTALALGLVASVSLAQVKPIPVKAGSTERKAVVEALRGPFRKNINGKPVIFKVDEMKMQEGFVFMKFSPLQPNGKPFDYHGTPYQKAIDDGFFDGQSYALLKKTGAKWKLLALAIGPTDVAYEPWPEKFHAPRELMGLPPRG